MFERSGPMTIRLQLVLALAALAFAFPVSAGAVAANVVPNAGFEQTTCSGTSTVCSWVLSPGPYGLMSLDTVNVHSGSASLWLGWAGETGGSFGLPAVEASTDPAVCAAIGPGAHRASYWYANASGGVAMSVAFYQGADCTGTVSYRSLSDSPSGAGWRQVTGTLAAPAGTQSALFSLLDSPAWCDNYSGCSFSANFDDLVVDDAALSTPAIGSFTPSTGPGGTSVDILGVNFTAASSVKFGGAAASFTVDSDTEIHAIVPSGALTGPITVTTHNGSGTSNDGFGVTPTISSFSPTCGPAGTSIDIVGSGFTGATRVAIGGTDTTFTVDSDAEIHATITSGYSGAVFVATPSGSTLSSSQFCASPAPRISSFTPTTGPPGTSVDILGSNYTGASSVTFAGAAARYVVDSDSEIHATVPATASSGPIAVTTASGTGTSASTFTVKPNAPPTASFTFSCSSLSCTLDASTSTDPDGTIASYAWDFGDGTTGSGRTTAHTYANATASTATLTVTDNDGATATAAKTITPIVLTARGYKVNGLERVDLSWTGPSGASFDIYRNSTRIATVQANTYTDKINKKAPGSYTYKTCAAALSSCSNPVTVSF
jgi:PKD repeat protein